MHDFRLILPDCITYKQVREFLYAAVNGYLELTLVKDRQRFDAVSTSNLEVFKFWDW